MNETQKTGIFAAIAAVAVLLAFLTRPEAITKEDEKGEFAAGDVLFKDEAADATKAASLKITKFDENKLSMSAFEIVRDKDSGLWKIPSEYSYPADAEEQLKNATSPLAGLKILSIQEEASRDDHALYGVIEPSEKLEAGVTGVGMMVNVADSTGKPMASLIIGKKVNDAQGDLHYVRIPNQDPIYTVEIDTSVFDTDFKKWIKPDLLGVKSFDIKGIGIRDYQTQQQATSKGVRVGMSRTMEADFSFDSATNKWALDRLVNFDGGQPVPGQLGEGEEVKSDKLSSIRTAAQSLQIVGVRPKPKGLAADLKADKALLENDESMVSLLDQGFVPHEVNGATEILATAGETLLTTGDGVRYTLRFGEENVVSTALEAGAEATSKQERFLLVTASVDESQFPPPDLQPVPETIEDLKRMDAEQAAAAAAAASAAQAASPTETTPAPPAIPAEPAPATEPAPTEPAPTEPAPTEPAPAGGDKSEPAAESPAEKPAPEAPAPEAPKVDEPAPAQPQPESATSSSSSGLSRSKRLVSTTRVAQDAAQPPADPPAQTPAEAPAETAASPAQPPAATSAQQPADAPAAPAVTEATAPAAQPATAQPATDQPPAAQPEKPLTDEELKDRLSVVQSDITKANQRLIDSRNEKLEAARKRVQQLNARFADWYYLIDEASFKQLMLKRDELIGPKTAAATPPAPAFPGLPSTPTLNLGPQQ